jgi:iron complex outermembrane receptor protein
MQSIRARAVLTGIAFLAFSATCIRAQAPIEKRMTLRLTDPSGAVVANGIATLKNNQTTQTYSLPLDQNKEFLLPKLNPGSYTLVVEAPGFRKAEQILDLTDATPSPLQVVLQVAGSSTTVSVTDSAARDESYEVVRNTSASRVDLPLLDIPQDVATVPRAVLQDQRVMNLSDATRNVAGAATDFGFNGGSEPLIILRGFQATSMTAQGTMSGMSSYYVDGTKVEGIPVDMADVQTVEVIKGPETVLYGRAEPGGIVNVVPRPFEHQPSFSLEQTCSTYSTTRSIAEASGPLDRVGRWLGRGTAAWTQNRSNRDFVRDRLGSGWAGIQWNPSSSDQLTLNASYTDQNYRNDYGIPADVDTGIPGNVDTRRPFDLPWSRQFNDSPELSYVKPLSGNLFARHAFSEDWSASGKLIMTVADTHDADITPYRVDLTTGGNCFQEYDGLCLYYYYVNPRGQYRLHQENVEFHGALRQGVVRHQLLIGGDFYGQEKKGTLYFEQLGGINIFNPVFTPQPKLDISMALPDPTIDINDWNSGYFQDNISIGQHLHVVGAVRLDGTSAIYGAPTLPLNKQFFVSPRAGVVWQFLRSTSVYGQFQNAVDANNGRDGNGVALAAERSREFEGGFKYQAPSSAWTATLAIYQLTKSNRADYSLYPIITTIGEARSRGVELDVLGRVTSRLATIFSYGYTEAVVTKDVSFQGTFLADVPRHGGSVWARYAISKNWTAGLGEFAQSFRQGDQPNSFILPGYGRTDAMLSYGFVGKGVHTTIQANVDNLLNKRYYSGSHQLVQDWIQPGAPRTVLLSVRFSH